MRKMNETIVVRDVYDYGELMKTIPFGCEELYHIRVGKYGFLHDVGTEIVLEKTHGETPCGWDALESDLGNQVAEIREIWKLAEYGYH